jgi:hypothetical protein
MRDHHNPRTCTNRRNSPTPPTSPAPSERPDSALDIGTALSLLAGVVRDRGDDYTYRPVCLEKGNYFTCLYARDGSPDCLVGVVLGRAGVPAADLEAFGDAGIHELYFAGAVPVTMTFGAVVVLRAAQLAQDRGGTWGEALLAAEMAAADFMTLVPRCVLRTVDA